MRYEVSYPVRVGVIQKKNPSTTNPWYPKARRKEVDVSAEFTGVDEHAEQKDRARYGICRTS